MDLASLLGLLTAVLSIIIALTLEGNKLSALINIPAMLIILGGTIGATVFSLPWKQVGKAPGLLLKAFQSQPRHAGELIEILVELAETARQEGLLALESRAQNLEDNLLRQGIGFAVDGIDPEEIKRVLEEDIFLRQQELKKGAAIFEIAGGYALTMGIIGTVIGLVHVVSNISDTTKLAGAIAVAFLATLYGIATANIFWLPIASKLKSQAEEQALMDHLVLEGILAIVQGKNPRLIRRELEILAGIAVFEEAKGL